MKELNRHQKYIKLLFTRSLESRIDKYIILGNGLFNKLCLKYGGQPKISKKEVLIKILAWVMNDSDVTGKTKLRPYGDAKGKYKRRLTLIKKARCKTLSHRKPCSIKKLYSPTITTGVAFDHLLKQDAQKLLNLIVNKL